MQVLSPVDLPGQWWYPKAFVRVVELGLVDLEPWQILEGELLQKRFAGLRKRYRRRRLVPFAARQDNDDVACWEPEVDPARVFVVHDFADPGWERRAEYDDFNGWLRQAVEDLIEFGYGE